MNSDKSRQVTLAPASGKTVVANLLQLYLYASPGSPPSLVGTEPPARPRGGEFFVLRK